jgi:VCBS repeat-containing protein
MARARSSFIQASLTHLSGLLGSRKKGRRSRGILRARRRAARFEWLEGRAMFDGSPSFATITDQSVLGGAPTWVGIAGADAGSGPLTYSVSVSNPSLLLATIPTGNKSLVLSTSGAETGVTGQMTFELLDNLVPNTTQHIESLVNDGEFATNSTFYRIAYSGTDPFVIQGGPSNATSSLGAMDDEFNPDLQFTSAGLLAMAKSTDDTGDSQVFVTAGPTRFLDFQHSIFGVLTAGDSVRQAIQNSNTSGDGAPPSAITISGAQIVTDTTNAALELKAARGASGTSDVTVTVTNNAGQTFQQTFHVIVSPDTESPAPYLNPITAPSGVEGQPINLQLTATDVTGGADVFDATKPASETTNYTLNVDHNTGLVTVTPPVGFTGTLHVQLSVQGANTRTTADPSDTETVAINVAAATLSAANDTATVTENASSTSINVLGNDTGTGLTITSIGTSSAGGTVAIASDSHSVNYTPPANFTGTDTFTYTVTDEHSATATATATVTVSSSNSTTTTSGTLSGFVYFDVNNSGIFESTELGIGGVAITLTGTKTSDNSAVSLTTKTADDGSYSFTGLDAGSYTIKQTQPSFVIDGQTTSASGTATTNQIVIALSAGGSAVSNNFGELGRELSTISIRDFFSPTAGSDNFAAFDSSGNELWHTLDASVWQGFSGESFSDAAGTLKVSATNSLAQPVSGSVSTSSHLVDLVSQSSGGSLYRLMADPAQIDFTATGAANSSGSGSSSGNGSSSGDGTSNTTTTNQTPTAAADSYSTGFNTPLTISAAGVLSNDTDPQSKSLTAVVATQPAHGSLTLAADGSFTYTPTSGFAGSDNFTYTATNGTQTSDAATVTITVAAAPGPTAIAHSYSINQNTTLNIDSSSGVLTGASDPQGVSLTAAVAASTTHGTLSLASDGSFVYTPTTDFTGSDSFTYTVTNGTTTSQPASVTITVVASNVPTVNSDNYAVTQDTTLTIAAPGVLTNDTDPLGGTLTAAAVAQPTHGSLTLNADGSFSYTPTAGYTGSDSFTYTAANSATLSVPATVTITISPPDHPPVSAADSYSVDENGTLQTTAANGVLLNDTDADNQSLTAELVSQPAHGSISLNADGTFVYTPATNYSGSDSFTYNASDGTALSSATTVSITVNHINQPPTATDDSYAVAAGGVLDVPAPQAVLANDTDPDNDPLTATQVSDVSNGTLTLNSDGSFTYVPSDGFSGSDSFTYKANDGQLDSSVVTVTIAVGPTTNVAPLAIDDAYTAVSPTLVIDAISGVLANDQDANGDALTAQLVIQPSHGAVTLNSDGSFTYTPDSGYTGDDAFLYQANDGSLNSNLAKVTISVSAAGEGEASDSLAHDAALMSLLQDGQAS